MTHRDTKTYCISSSVNISVSSDCVTASAAGFSPFKHLTECIGLSGNIWGGMLINFCCVWRQSCDQLKTVIRRRKVGLNALTHHRHSEMTLEANEHRSELEQRR